MTRVLAKALDPETTTVREVMTPNPVCVPPETRCPTPSCIMIETGFPPPSHRRAGIEDPRRFLGARCIAARDRHRAQPDRVQRAGERRARVGGRAWPGLGPAQLRSRRACAPLPRLRPHACGPAGPPAWRGPSLPAAPRCSTASRSSRCAARAIALQRLIGLRLRPGLPAGAARGHVLHADAIHRTDRNAQFAAGAIRLDHGVHALVAAQDGVGRDRPRCTACSRCTRLRR